MNERTLKVLEFDKVVTLLMENTSTLVGKELAKQISPKTDIREVQLAQEETDEALTIIRLNKSLPLSHVEDVTEQIKRSVIGGTLNEKECLHIAQILYTTKNVKSFIEGLEENKPLLEAIVTELSPLAHLEKTIKAKIDEQGHVADDASVKLRSLRSTIRTLEARIRERLQQIMRSKSKMLSDMIVTIRNNRFVLPVKQEYRASIGGIVHDQSSSGQTLFMEPNAIVELNNNLQQTIVAERQEINVILQKLTAEIAEFSNEILTNLQIIAQIDFIFARARLSVQMKAAKPKLNEQGIINMKLARHPLIPLEDVVANDISLGEDYQAIVITGPNTGGKTVTLKTVGLCTLMAQSGLQVPALDGCQLAVFQKIFADIGDEQSIEQNLSTFSSHMTNIVNIMEELDDTSLVLFDELGSGTDPQEGAALAMALLDKVISQRAQVIATTHYPELKAYGYNRDGVMNASVEFDLETLRPTYRLLIGVPGRSNAFEISKRLGLSDEIIRKAKSYIGIDSKNVENMIKALEDTKKAAERELAETHELLVESEKIKADLQSEWDNYQAERDKLYKKAEEKAKRAIEQAREEAEIIVNEVREMKDKALFKEHEWIEARKLLDEATPELITRETKESEDSHELQVGDQVKHKTLQQIGEIIEEKNKDEFIIQVGQMRVTAKRKELQFVNQKRNDKVAEEKPRVMIVQGDSVKNELDLRGVRYEDAMYQLEEYIDRVLLQGYPRATIIHGQGTGAIRKGVQQYVKNSPYVKAYRHGGQGEGGTGVTIIEF